MAKVWPKIVSPAVDYPLVDAKDIKKLKATILDSILTVHQLVRTASGSAASFRDVNFSGGANGARIRLATQKDWPVNSPAELAKVVNLLDGIQANFNAKYGSIPCRYYPTRWSCSF